MTNRPTPAYYFREASHSNLAFLCELHLLKEMPPNVDDIAFQTYLLRTLEYGRRISNPGVIYFCTIGLVAFGELKYVGEFLDHLLRDAPTGLGRALWAGKHLGQLIPIPDSLCPVNNTEEVRSWLETNRNGLNWDEAHGEYTLSACDNVVEIVDD